MRAWAKWCINHNLRWIVYLTGFIYLPLYFIYYIPEALSDWVRDMKSIKLTKKEEA